MRKDEKYKQKQTQNKLMHRKKNTQTKTQSNLN